jgi:hypothetical protein
VARVGDGGALSPTELRPDPAALRKSDALNNKKTVTSLGVDPLEP